MMINGVPTVCLHDQKTGEQAQSQSAHVALRTGVSVKAGAKIGLASKWHTASETVLTITGYLARP